MKPIVGGMRFLRHLEKTLDLPFECEIHDTIMVPVTLQTAFQVFINSTERDNISEPSESIIENSGRYDLILTVDRSVLDRIKHAVDFPFGGSWVWPRQPKSKEFSVSFLLSSASVTPLHHMRQDIWRRQSEVRVPKRFYVSSMRPPRLPRNGLLDRLHKRMRTLPGGDKMNLFDSMFSVCPENWQQRGYFTEKIIDAFATRTVPLYLGCTNIREYFDTDGIILFEDVDHLIRSLNGLTPESYHSRRAAVEANYSAALEYVDFDQRLKTVIELAHSRKGAYV